MVNNTNFISISNKIHNNFYNYSFIKEYRGTMVKYNIQCPIHGIWKVSLDNHIVKKSGCPKCKGFNLTYKEKNEISRKIHKHKYSYSLIIKDYKHKEKIPITCKYHGVFYQTYDNHVNKKQGCPQCKNNRKKVNKQLLIYKIKELKTGYKYNWESLGNYFDNTFLIRCNKHGWFNQQPSNHLMGQKCPKCNGSRGEERVENYLKYKGIKYITQKTFNGLKNKNNLYFDFYLPDYDLCIEFDGQLHFKSIEFFGGDLALLQNQKHDKIKNDYCINNKIKLLRIHYKDINNIEKIIDNEI